MLKFNHTLISKLTHLEQIGSMDKLLEYYKKDSEQDSLKMFELNKNAELAKKMQQAIIEDIEVTPEEVRQFFNSIPKSDRPVFGTELRFHKLFYIQKLHNLRSKRL